MTIRKQKQAMSGRLVRLTAIGTLASVLAIAGGCSNAGEGAISGAGLGALGGLAIGSLYGSAGKGAAIGAVAGGIGGAMIGDQNERADRRARERHYRSDW